MWLILVIIILLLIIYNLIISKKNKINKFYDSNKINIECVIARYNESIDWILMPECYNITKFIIYNKGTPLHTKLPDNAIEIRLKNIGKCDHTFLYHIINNYYNLADITLFISGSTNHYIKQNKILQTIELVNKTLDSVFIGQKNIVPDNIWNFTIDDWLSRNSDNQIGDGKISKLIPSKVRPFGKWFNNFWPDKHIDLIVYTSIFAVNKKHIIQHSIDYYMSLYNEFGDDVNPEVGHYIERAWAMIFYPYPSTCKYYSIY